MINKSQETKIYHIFTRTFALCFVFAVFYCLLLLLRQINTDMKGDEIYVNQTMNFKSHLY